MVHLGFARCEQICLQICPFVRLRDELWLLLRNCSEPGRILFTVEFIKLVLGAEHFETMLSKRLICSFATTCEASSNQTNHVATTELDNVLRFPIRDRAPFSFCELASEKEVIIDATILFDLVE